MAVAVFSSSQRWGDRDRGVQLFGTCAVAAGRRVAEAERLYAARFPDFTGWKASIGDDDVARGYRFYRFVARELKVLDEDAFGDGRFVRAVVDARTRLAP